jgi:hypothetical protein
MVGLGTGAAWLALALDLSPLARLAAAAPAILLGMLFAWRLTLPPEIRSQIQSLFTLWLGRLRSPFFEK